MFKRPPTELDRPAIGMQFAAMRQELEKPELDPGHDGTLSHW
jgi:hypothetical protein